jgi:succinoglycan biosynthesis protein ExoA
MTRPAGVPLVTVVVPVLDERAHIDANVDALERQDYPLDRIEVLFVDGGSTDGSRERVTELAAGRPWLRLVDNPDRRASSAFNRGIEASNGEIICLVGGHAEVGPDYVARSVEVLDETGAAGVGGMLRHEGDERVTRAIGLAMTSPFGMASPFRYATSRRDVDTIGHPAYRAAVLAEVGPFDESLERNSDYELNHRIRAAGHRLVFEPAIVTSYRPRSTLRTLARQFHDYGRAKADVLRATPESAKLRHLVPPAATLAVALAPALLATARGRRLVAVAAAGYSTLLVVAAVRSRPDRHDADPVAFVAAFPVMHLSWGSGFWRTVLGWVGHRSTTRG